jgi:cell division protein ZapA (FtsZ GTPase activity inhibitor)
MRKIAFTINGRAYELVVDSDQTAHVQQLTDEIDSRARTLSVNNPHADESTILMMTCLILADELYAARQEAGALHETFMLAQPELQQLFPLSHFAEAEGKVSELVEKLSHHLDTVLRPVPK